MAASALAGQQTTRLRGETPFHADPQGTPLGTLLSGVSVRPGNLSGGRREVTFEAWIWTQSLGPANRPGFTHQVTPVGGENLRAAPNADVIGRAVQGTQLVQLTRQGGWTRVRRTAWVPAAALEDRQTAGRGDGQAERRADGQAAEAGAPGDPAPAPRRVDEDLGEPVIVRRGARLLTGPGGAAVGVAPEDVAGRVTARQGNWVRVRTETWAREEDVRPRRDSAEITLEQLRAEPERYVGQRVAWRLQFIELRQADELRPELAPGQPYVLARGPLPEAGFVYLSVTVAQAERLRRMNPLDEFLARGVIRAARTRFLPTPVIQLIDG